MMAVCVRFGKLASVFRLRPFDTSLEAGRTKERYRRIVLTTLSTVAAKGVSLLSTAVSVPITLHYLGQERYGLWMTISSLVVMLSFADLGLGNGLLNAIAQSSGRDDRDSAHKAVSSAFFILLGQALLIGIVALAASQAVDWARFFHLGTDVAETEAGPAVLAFFLVIAVSLPLAVVQRVLDGYQEGYKNNFWQGAGNLFGLAALLLVVRAHLGLPLLILAYAGVPVLGTVSCFVVEFWVLRPWLRPRLRSVERRRTHALFHTGLTFLVLNVFTLISLQSDNLIISRILGASAVAPYAVVQRLSQVAVLLWSFLAALWPAYGEAIAREDYVWVRRTLRYSLVVALGCGTLIGLAISLFGKKIVSAWVGAEVAPDAVLLNGFAMYVLISGFIGSFAMVLNASSLAGKQLPLLGLTAVSSVLLKVLLCYTVGASAVIWATVISYGFFYCIPATLLVRRAFWGARDASPA